MKLFALLTPILALGLCSCSSADRSKFDPRAAVSPGAVDPAFSAGPAAAPPPEMLAAPADAYKLGPGDKLDIEILGETGSRAETFVTPDSKIYFNLLAGQDVGGKTTEQVRQELETNLAQYYKRPQVSVTLVEALSQRFWILGRVNSPGIYPLKRPMKVLDAVSLAGGLFTSRFTGTTEELADLSHSFIMRGTEMLPVDFQKLIRGGDMAQNVYLQPDDFIYLPSSLTNEVYVLGAVVEPRPVGFMNEMNLMAAIGRGLGLKPDADLTRVSIIRGSLSDPKIAVVNAKDVMTGKATNIRLEPGDIIFVPGSGQISSEQLGREAVNTFVRVVAAGEGGRAATGTANVGVNIDITGAN